MLDRQKEIAEKQEQAKSSRKKGDALRKAGRDEAAREAYEAGVDALSEGLEMLRTEDERLRKMSTPEPAALRAALGELVEMFGARGGMLQRLGRLKEALSSYQRGGDLEERFGLPSTYNRLNAIKCSLLSGDKRLGELEPQIRELANMIEADLRGSQSVSTASGWAYADLGDCMALLDNKEGARRAYATFISMAEIKSPERTLDVLQEIASKLTEFADPLASRLRMAIDVLQNELGR
jgi:tetratricopeptide (TPR) repeat protein